MKSVIQFVAGYFIPAAVLCLCACQSAGAYTYSGSISTSGAYVYYDGSGGADQWTQSDAYVNYYPEVFDYYPTSTPDLSLEIGNQGSDTDNLNARRYGSAPSTSLTYSGPSGVSTIVFQGFYSNLGLDAFFGSTAPTTLSTNPLTNASATVTSFLAGGYTDYSVLTEGGDYQLWQPATVPATTTVYVPYSSSFVIDNSSNDWDSNLNYCNDGYSSYFYVVVPYPCVMLCNGAYYSSSSRSVSNGDGTFSLSADNPYNGTWSGTWSVSAPGNVQVPGSSPPTYEAAYSYSTSSTGATVTPALGAGVAGSATIYFTPSSFSCTDPNINNQLPANPATAVGAFPTFTVSWSTS